MPGVPHALKPFVRHFEVARDRDCLSNRPRRTEAPQRPACATQNPLHAGVRHSDDIGELTHQAELDHAGKQFVGRPRDAARRLGLSGAEINAEAAAFPDRRACRRGLAVQKCRERIAEHRWTGGRQEPHAALDAVVVVLLQEIDRTAGIEFVDFHVAADLHVPAEPFLENPVAKPMHFGEVVDELAVAIGVDELEHIRLLAGLVLRDRRRSAGVFSSCAVAQGSEAGTYSLVDLAAANFATAWQMVRTPNLVFALSR